MNDPPVVPFLSWYIRPFSFTVTSLDESCALTLSGEGGLDTDSLLYPKFGAVETDLEVLRQILECSDRSRSVETDPEVLRQIWGC